LLLLLRVRHRCRRSSGVGKDRGAWCWIAVGGASSSESLLESVVSGRTTSCSLLPSCCRARCGWLPAFALLLLLLTGGAAFSELLTIEVSGSWCWGLLLRRSTISNPSGPCRKLDDELLLLPGVGVLHWNRGSSVREMREDWCTRAAAAAGWCCSAAGASLSESLLIGVSV
jgi:hypothetical protein